MVAMVEAHVYQNATLLGKTGQGSQFIDMARARFLHQHMFSRFNCACNDLCKGIMRRCNHYDLNVVPTNCLPPVLGKSAPSRSAGDVFGLGKIAVRAGHQAGARQPLGSLLADYAASDDGDIHLSSPHVMPRSLGTMRRSV